MRLFITCTVSVLLVLCFPFILSEVVDSFNKCSQFFLNGRPPVIPGILENSVSENTNYTLICQKYMKHYRFATLYDKARRIPVFSAYKFTGFREGREGNISWKIERQLEPYGADMKVPFVNQASNGDFCTRDFKNQQLSRGHLYPNSHADNNETKISTFTLTNIVPQKARFNSGSWSIMENWVRMTMNNSCRDIMDNNKISAYVLTGAIPGQNTVNGRVNIPSHMWTVFCCYHKTNSSFVSKAHWAENVNDNENLVQSTSRGKRHRYRKGTIPTRSLKNLEEFLEKNIWPNIRLFDNCRGNVTHDEGNLLDTQILLDHVEDQGPPCVERDALQ